MVTSDRLSIASSVVTIVHSLDYEHVTKAPHHSTGKSDILSVRTDNVLEQLSPCSSNMTTQESSGQSPPQYSEEGYTGINGGTTVDTSKSVQTPELVCSPTCFSGYIPITDGVFFDNHNSNVEFPEVPQCYGGNNETTDNISRLCRNKLTQDYVDAEVSVSDPKYPLRSLHSHQDFGEIDGKGSSLHDLCGSLIIDEEVGNSSEHSCSPFELPSPTMSPVEENEEAIRHEENSSPKYMTESECGYIEFQSVIRQDVLLHSNPGHKTSDICSGMSDLYQHQNQMDTSIDQFVGPHQIQDSEPYSSRSEQLLRLSKCHGSASSIDSGYVRECDFS